MKGQHKETRDIILYLAIAFIPAYILDYTLLLPLLHSTNPLNQVFFLTGAIVRMMLPLIASLTVLYLNNRLSEWRTQLGLINPNIRNLLLAGSSAITLYTMALVFSILFGSKPSSCGFLAQMTSTITKASLILVLLILGILAGSTVNMIVAVGEEAGWRGLLLNMLSPRIGIANSAIVIGIIWGLWHAPLIIAGYNYSLPGIESCIVPAKGLVALIVFTLTTISFTQLLVWLRVKTGSTLVSAAAHGTINAVAGLYSLLISGSALITPPAGLSVAASASILVIILKQLTGKKDD
ncbi:MAG: CPBP family intramembrane metalloprotease [Desulfurococcales archaeon]|nr:CPBP family intramembrane metalloprotease [Desulfurococcales archaeon]